MRFSSTIRKTVRKTQRAAPVNACVRSSDRRPLRNAAAVTAAVLAGAHIVRVHAVGEMVQVVRVAEEIRRHAP